MGFDVLHKVTLCYGHNMAKQTRGLFCPHCGEHIPDELVFKTAGRMAYSRRTAPYAGPPPPPRPTIIPRETLEHEFPKLRALGMSYQAIAEKLGYAHASGVSAAVRRWGIVDPKKQ